jgi:hypothetical protein
MADEPDAAAHPDSAPEVESAELAAKARVLHVDHVLELVATIVLGAATIATAWSGYQAALWNGVQATDYVQASGSRVESTRASTLAGQQQLYDSQVFSQWLNAHFADNEQLAGIYERRFRDEFRVAFQAWLATDPFTNANAPPGPLFMPQYVQAKAQEADQLEAKATATLEAGQAANATSDRYVQFTVIFASALFLAATSDRFRWRSTRVAVLAMAIVALAFGLINLAQLPIQ